MQKPEKENFNNIIEQILNGEDVSQYVLLPFLMLESKKERAEVNKNLAMAYFMSNSKGSIEKTEVFIKRACLFSEYSEENLELAIKIFKSQGKIEIIKELYKRTAIAKLSNEEFESAIRYFDKWLYTYSEFQYLDKYSYDLDILNAIDDYSKKYGFNKKFNLENYNSSKIKIGYLIKDILVLNSVLVKINLQIAEYQDYEKFEISWFFPETLSEIEKSPQGMEIIEKAKSFGCKIFPAVESDNLEERLLSVAKQIEEEKIHILVTSAALSYFNHYFITSLKPAPVLIGLMQGPPPQFTPPILDWSISSFVHPLIDSTVNSTYVQLELELPRKEKIARLSKQEFGIPDDSIILMSGGRHVKFQDKEIWKAIINLLKNYGNLYFIAVGPGKEQIPFLGEFLSKDVERRIILLGWRKDYLDIISIADIVLDTYPSGGGVFFLEAMAIGKPVVTFENNYLQEFNQVEWSVGIEYAIVPSLVLKRGDYNAIEDKISELIEKKEVRDELGKICEKTVRDNVGKPERMVKKYEEIYVTQFLKMFGEKCVNIDYKNYSLENNEYFLSPEDKVVINNSFLRIENFNAWQKAYKDGYNGGMGDHRNYFYNKYLNDIDYYNEVASALKIAEFAPGNGDFIQKLIWSYPSKEFYLIDISEKNLSYLQDKFGANGNIRYILNNKKSLPIEEIDSVFSFLLCQSIPKSLWLEHLFEVKKILSNKGSYVFQFAYLPGRSANDSIPYSISGSQIYSVDDMLSMLKTAGFKTAEITEPIDLSTLNTDIVWYICKVKK